MDLSHFQPNEYEEQVRQQRLKVKAAQERFIPRDLIESLKPKQTLQPKRVVKSSVQKPPAQPRRSERTKGKSVVCVDRVASGHTAPMASAPEDSPAPTTPRSAIVAVLKANCNDWESDEAVQSVATQLREHRITAGQIEQRILTEQDLVEMQIAIGDRKRILPPLEVSASKNAGWRSKKCRKEEGDDGDTFERSKADIVCGHVTKQVNLKAKELQALGHKNLRAALQLETIDTELGKWLSLVAEKQTKLNKVALAARPNAKEDEKVQLRTPFTADEVKTKLEHRKKNNNRSQKENTAAAAAETEATKAAAAAAGTTSQPAVESGRTSGDMLQQHTGQLEMPPATKAQTGVACSSPVVGSSSSKATIQQQQQISQSDALLQALREMAGSNAGLMAALRTAEQQQTGQAGQLQHSGQQSEQQETAAVVPEIKLEPDAPRFDADGQQLSVGDIVQLLATDNAVAAVGTVLSVTTNSLLNNKDKEAKVKDKHVALGRVKVEDSMQKAAASVTFWCDQKKHGLQMGNGRYTFWSKRAALTKDVLVSVPSNRLRRVKK